MNTFLMALAALPMGGPTVASTPAEWPMYRHDKQLTARSEGVGDLTAPAISWQYDLRAWEVTVALTHTVGAGLQASPATAGPFTEARPLSPEEQAAWGLGAPRIDLAGDGQLVPAPSQAAQILADVPGYQYPGTVMEDSVKGWCVLYAHDGGKQREVWRSPQFDVYQGPHPIVVDANGDGQLDVVACPHYQIAVLDGRTGQIIEQLRWHDGRNYGHFIAKDIDGDGVPEFLVLADFYTHIDMIDNDGKELKLRWRKEIELKIENKQKILRPRWDSLQDLDGDGRFEVITNLYNDTGDKKWHLMIYDALTGDTVLDLPETFLEGLEDLDGDGVTELFCSTTDALYVPTSSRLRLLNLAHGQAVEKWAYPQGAWALGARPYPLYMNSLVAHGEKNIFVTDPSASLRTGLGPDGRGFYVTEPPADAATGPRLRAFRMDRAGQVEALWTLTGPRDAKSFEVLAARTPTPSPSPVHRGGEEGQPPQTLLRFRTAGTEPAPFQVEGGTAQAVAWQPIRPERPSWGDLIAADLDGQGQATIVSVAGNRDVVALSPPADDATAPTLRWRRPGTGPLCAADFNADGRKEVALLGWHVTGQGTVEVADGTGKSLWTSIVHGFPGPLEPWNFSTLTMLAAGRLSGGPQEDLIVFSRRSTMHSDEGHAFRGTDGANLWSRTESFDGAVTWGFGGTPVVTCDTNGDGAEDIISLYPVNLTVVSGRDGAQLVGRSAAGDDIFPGIWAAYATPTVFDFEKDGTPELVWNGGYCIGITDLAGITRWANTPAAIGGPVDATGDGVWDLASTAGNTLRWMNPADGSIRWSLELPANAGSSAVADIDGDGVEEVLVACGNQLLAAHVKEGQPKILWQLQAPAAILSFLLADTDGDGKVEIVLAGEDGWLYGVD